MEKIKKIFKDRRFWEYVEKNNTAEKNRKYCKHSFDHLLSVARIAYILLLEKGLGSEFSRDIVYASGMLHDIGRWKEYETGEDHAFLSAQLSGEILKDAGFEQSDVDVIAGAIKEHRSSENITGRTLLGEILHRADVLSRDCWQCSAREDCYKYDRMPTGEGLLY